MLLGTFVMQMSPRREGQNVGEVDAEALMIGSPSKNSLRWLQNSGCMLVQPLLGSNDHFWKELLFPESKPNLGA